MSFDLGWRYAFVVRNHPLSALILEMVESPCYSLESFEETRIRPLDLPSRLSLDCALNQLSCPESLPDTESFPGEGGLAQRFCVAAVVLPDLAGATASW